MTTTIWGYLNTRSSAGPIQEIEIDLADVKYVRCWHNHFGNPSYTYSMDNGDIIYLVDDYGAMNGLGRLSRDLVNRRKDLFPSWM